jgi:hypothetical protein
VNEQHDAFAHVLEAWLDLGGDYEDPDAVVERVVAQLPEARQDRQAWGMFGGPVMRGALNPYSAAVAIFVMAVAGLWLLAPAGGGLGSASPPPIVTPTASATATPTSGSPSIGPWFLDGNLVPGARYYTGDDRTASFQVPVSGWRVDQGVRLVKGHNGDPFLTLVYLAHLPPTVVYDDPCRHTAMNLPAEPSAAQLAVALSESDAMHVVRPPVPVTIDGRVGVTLTLGAPAATCDDYWLWADGPTCPDCGVFTAEEWGDPDATMAIWIVEAGGELRWLTASFGPAPLDDIQREVEQTMESIDWDP